MRGAVAPGGMAFKMLCASAVTSAIAPSTLVPGWRKILVTLTPFRDWLSRCSMPLTVVVVARSKGVVMRAAISSGDRPVYVLMTAITGMSISGSMSVDMVRSVRPPMITMSMARTTNVYGRLNAMRTIHMASCPSGPACG